MNIVIEGNIIELPDDLNSFSVIHQNTINCIVKVKPKLIIRETGHLTYHFLLLVHCFLLPMNGFTLCFTFLKLLFKCGLFLCQLIFAGKVVFGREFTFSILFVHSELFPTTGIILSLEQ